MQAADSDRRHRARRGQPSLFVAGRVRSPQRLRTLRLRRCNARWPSNLDVIFLSSTVAPSKGAPLGEAALAAMAAATVALSARPLRPARQRHGGTCLSADRSSSSTASRCGTTSGIRGATASLPTASSTTRSRGLSGSGCSAMRPSRSRRSPSPHYSGGSGATTRAGRAGRSRSPGRRSFSRALSRSCSASRSALLALCALQSQARLAVRRARRV